MINNLLLTFPETLFLRLTIHIKTHQKINITSFKTLLKIAFSINNSKQFKQIKVKDYLPPLIQRTVVSTVTSKIAILTLK